MAREEEKKEQEVEEGQPKKQGALVKWMAIGVVAAVVIAGAVVGVLYFKGDSGKKEAAQAKEQPVSAVWAMEPFIVNLVDNNGERYLKISVELEVSDKNVVAELTTLKPKLRDNVLDLLTAKSYKDLVDMVGKQRLRDEITMRLNSFLSGGKIVKVYFTEFVIQ
jgi:flagellar FliL protein